MCASITLAISQLGSLLRSAICIYLYVYSREGNYMTCVFLFCIPHVATTVDTEHDRSRGVQCYTV